MAKVDRLGWAVGVATIAYGHRVGLRVTDAAVLERAMACLPPGWKRAARPVVDCMYSIVVGGRSGKVRKFHLLYRGTERLARSHDLDEVFAALQEDLKLHVATAGRSRVFVHAGAVGWRGQAIVLPGRSYAGKTTLVAALVRAGATYYSDEFAVLDERGRVHPYPRPLVLRPRAGEASADASAVPTEFPVGRRPLPVRLVALTQYQAGERWRSETLTPGQAMLALMENAVPVRHRPETTLKTLKEVVSRAPVIKGVRGEVEDAVTRLLNEPALVPRVARSTKVSAGRRRRRRDDGAA